jgi:hypothetical protein
MHEAGSLVEELFRGPIGGSRDHAPHPDSEFARVLFKLLNDHVEERSRHLFSFLPSPSDPPVASMAAAGRAATVPVQG